MFNNNFFKIYLGLIIISLSTSVFTNMYSNKDVLESSNLKTLNNCSNNVLAGLLMPVYIPYRICKYIYNNFNLILTKIYNLFKFIFVDVIYDRIIINVIKLFDLILTKIYDLFKFILVDVIYDRIIINIINLFEYISKNLIVPFFKFITRQIKLNLIMLFDYLFGKLLPFLNAIITSFYQVCDLLVWGWNMFLYYIVYPIINTITNIYNLIIDILLKISIIIVDILYNLYIGLSDIWCSLVTTFESIYNNIILSIIQSWDRLMNLFY
jgi:hypothetical protein